MTPKETSQKVEIFLYQRFAGGGTLYLMLKLNEQRGSFWQPITGGVHVGESLEEAARREVTEETGLRPTGNLQNVGYSFSFFGHGRLLSEHVFGQSVASDVRVKLSDEHTAYKWVPYEEAIGMLKWEENKIGLRKLRDINRGEDQFTMPA